MLLTNKIVALADVDMSRARLQTRYLDHSREWIGVALDMMELHEQEGHKYPCNQACVSRNLARYLNRLTKWQLRLIVLTLLKDIEIEGDE